MKNILVICGPTASGKTSLALSVASYLTSENRDLKSCPIHILSADSRQIYRGLDIVTGKDIPKDLSPNIKIFGLDIAEPDETFNLSDFVNYSQKVIEDSLSQNIPLIIVGGTGLYLQAITSNLLNVNIPPNPGLRAELEKLDLPTLKKRLMEINSAKFASLNNSDANNPRRLIRAIEISSTTPRHLERSREISLHPENNTTFHFVGLRPDKDILAEKIRQRVSDRLSQGALTEVRALLAKYPDRNFPIFTSLGIKEIIDFLDKKISKEDLVLKWAKSEVEYARRQMVWFQKQPGIVWYDKSSGDQLVMHKLQKILK